MIFKGIRNQTVELNIVGYELPENLNCTYEANWLCIDLKIISDFVIILTLTLIQTYF